MIDLLPNYCCLPEDTWLLSTLIIGNVLILIAYILIPWFYYELIRDRPSVNREPSLSRIYMWVSAFMLSGALTHGTLAIMVYLGGFWYWVHASALFLTGAISLYTALFVIPTLSIIIEKREVLVSSIADRLRHEIEAKSKAEINDNMRQLDEVLTQLNVLRYSKEQPKDED